ncbi:signal transduction histidine kinase [Leptolyngbya sp. Heron Island J]|uniref:sensor histidine kinase n=1 Tax=Leptolyngbya sp. Heron Island J TaxID=1385935 RepID=UPI0003B99958|nr:ATP-binding protein [Leptolyngbya sp. Heron Island J]ESA34003.1 signal transduction histidine kinase [Leptolyngbya sp. Heron Island J]
MKPSRTLDFFREARTRIFLIYVAFMLIAVGLAVPIFRTLLFSGVDKRVNEDLQEEVEEFKDAYTEWLASENQSMASLKTTIDDYMSGTLPEDDNFLIAIVEDNVYRSNPGFLPNAINENSGLFETWTQLSENTQDQEITGDASIGDILYIVEPLVIDGELQGQFVIAHLSAGERQEALAGVYVFMEVVGGLLVLALALAWLTSGRLLKPVQDLAVTARAINETDLDSRIAVVGTGELADLATTFNAMMDRLQAAFNSQRNFINDAGHELRTPITIMQGHLELMGDDPVEQAETRDLILDELDRMGRLVNDLILIVKSEHPNFLRFETLDVAHLCTDLFTKAQTLADRDWQLAIETRTKIVADPQRLTGALLNLLNNAAQHTQTGDRITLGCRGRNGCVEFWVEDTGEGIPEAEQVRVFDRFARVQHTQRKSDGSGLGLAIVRAVVEAHGGRVGLSSQVNVGSVFTLTLPIEQPLVLSAYQEVH